MSRLEMASEALLRRNKDLEHELYRTKDSLRIVGDLRERYRAERDGLRELLSAVRSYDDANQSDLPIVLLDRICEALGGPR